MTAFGWATSRQIQLKAPSLPSPTNVQGENDETALASDLGYNFPGNWGTPENRPPSPCSASLIQQTLPVALLSATSLHWGKVSDSLTSGFHER